MNPAIDMAFALVTALRCEAKKVGSPLDDMPIIDAFVLAEQKGLEAMGHLGAAVDLLHETGLCVVTVTSVDERSGTQTEAIRLSEQGYDVTDAEVRVVLYPDAD